MEEKKKFSAKDRSNFLFDDNSMFELGSKLCGDGAGVITGYGTINGKLVYYFSQDYSVKGGAVNSYNAKKICDVMDMAAKMGAPIVSIYDSCGAVLEEGLEVLNSYGEILKRAAKYSGVIPQIAVIAGPCTGTLAICASMSDFTIMVEDQAEMYIIAPENYTEIEGEFISSKDYADYKVLGQNGTALLKAKCDEKALSLVKDIVKSIPSNNLDFAEDMPKALNFADVENYSNLDELVNSFIEQDSEIEINADFEKEIKTSLVKINGLTVGVVGVGRKTEVKLDGAKLDKITKMVKLCNSFNMPILTLVNSDGFVKSLEEEKNGLSLKAAKLSAVIASATVPKVSLIVGKSYGAVFTMLSDKKSNFDVVYALKTSKIALIDVKTQVSVLYKEDIKNASNKEERINELIKLNEEALSSSIKAAEKGYIDDVLENEDVAINIIASFEMLKTKREIGYSKKHGSILV